MRLVRKQTARNRFLRTASLDAAIIAMILLAAELALRTFTPSWATLPSTENETFGHPVRYNSFGFRGPEFPISKPAGEYRVVIFGNSVTAGTGVAQENIFTAQLQDIIDRRSTGRKVLIINAAGQGGGIPVFQKFWSEYGERLSADLAIIVFTAPMIAQSANPAEKKSGDSRGVLSKLRDLPFEIHKLLYKFYAYTTFDTQFRKRLYSLGILKDDLSRQSSYGYAFGFDLQYVELDQIEEFYRKFERRLTQLRDAITGAGVKLLIVNVPSRFTLSFERGDNFRNYPLKKIRIRPSIRIRNIADRHGISFLDLQAPFMRLRSAMLAHERPYRPLYIPNDHNHLDEQGHKIVASHLAKRIGSLAARPPVAPYTEGAAY